MVSGRTVGVCLLAHPDGGEKGLPISGQDWEDWLSSKSDGLFILSGV